MFSHISALELLKHVCFHIFDAQRTLQGPAVVPQGETGVLRWVILVPGARHRSHPCSRGISCWLSDAGPGLLRGARLPQPRWEFRLCLNPKREELRVDAHLAVWGGKIKYTPAMAPAKEAQATSTSLRTHILVTPNSYQHDFHSEQTLNPKP